MKRSIYLVFTLIAFAGYTAAAQSLDEASVKKMMQGDWQQKDNENFTISITGDTLMEVNNGNDRGTETFTFTVTKTNCNKDPLSSSLTGFYLSETSLDNNKPLCGAIDAVSATRLKITYNNGDQIMEFIRPQ